MEGSGVAQQTDAWLTGAAIVGRTFFNWFDHPLIEGWREAGLRAELHREHPAPPYDRPLERLEVPVIEPHPDVTREPVKRAAVHSLDKPAPALDNNRRRR